MPLTVESRLRKPLWFLRSLRGKADTQHIKGYAELRCLGPVSDSPPDKDKIMATVWVRYGYATGKNRGGRRVYLTSWGLHASRQGPWPWVP
jgi:hypothetical protein